MRACRLYNKGLVNQKYILKLIKEYVPNYSLTNFVKKIPDQSPSSTEQYLGVGHAPAIFLQQATMCTFNRIASRHIFQHAFKQYPDLEDKLQESYKDMIMSFEQSQAALWGQTFCVPYDEQSKRLESKGGKEARISYFSDFIFMQQLMTLEIDIILGQTHDNIRHLGGQNKNSDTLAQMEARKKVKAGGPKEPEVPFKFRAIDFSTDVKNIEPASNRAKIDCLEG